MSAHVVIDCKNESGIIGISDQITFDPFKLMAIISGPSNLDTIDSDFESEFRYCQASALLAYISSFARRQLNKPFGGSHFSNCGTLFEQWKRVDAANIPGVSVPKWEIGDFEWPLSSGKVMLTNPFQISFEEESNSSLAKRFGAVIEKPKGTIGSYAFCRDKSHLIIYSDGKWISQSPTLSIAEKFNKIVGIFRDSCGIDFGEIYFSYLGEVLFLCITPTISDEHFFMKDFEVIIEDMTLSIT